MNIEMPRGLTKKYGVKGAYLAETESKEDREAAIHECVHEINLYFERFNEVRSILEATEDRFKTVEDRMLRAESMDAGLSTTLAEQKRSIEDMRIAITDLHADLEDDALPDIIKFQDTPSKALTMMVRLSETNLKIRDAIRKYHLAHLDEEDDEEIEEYL